MMSPDEARVEMEQYRQKMRIDAEKLEAARVLLVKAPPCGATPSREFSAAMGGCLQYCASILVNFVQREEIKARLVQEDAAWLRATRRDLAKGIAARAMNIAWLIFAVGFLVLSINARSILDRIMPPRSTVQVQTERSKP